MKNQMLLSKDNSFGDLFDLLDNQGSSHPHYQVRKSLISQMAVIR